MQDLAGIRYEILDVRLRLHDRQGSDTVLYADRFGVFRLDVCQHLFGGCILST